MAVQVAAGSIQQQETWAQPAGHRTAHDGGAAGVVLAVDPGKGPCRYFRLRTRAYAALRGRLRAAPRDDPADVRLHRTRMAAAKRGFCPREHPDRETRNGH